MNISEYLGHVCWMLTIACCLVWFRLGLVFGYAPVLYTVSVVIERGPP